MVIESVVLPPSNPLTYGRKHLPRFLQELKEFIRFPSVSAHPHRADDMKRCAAWLSVHLKKIGLEQVRSIPTRRHPIVYAQWLNAPSSTILLIYGHYDVQPVEPLNEWRTPPFEPTVRGEYLYGRGASDDKGQLWAQLKALEAYLHTNGSLPVNVKCIFEGEEEIGSPNLAPFILRNRHALAANVAAISDTAILALGRPAIIYALRGSLSIELEVQGPKQDLHSGTFGGAVHNPIQALSEIIAGLHTDDGRVAVEGFYDDVRDWGDKERKYMAHVGPLNARLLRNARVNRSWGELGYTLYERTTIRPALTVNGITGGYQGPDSKGVIPARAQAKLSIRFVPDQDPRKIEHLFRKHIERITPPSVSVTIRSSSPVKPTLINRDQEAMHSAVAAYKRGFGRRPVFLRSGGTIPVVNTLQDLLGIPIVLMGFGLPDDGIHSPNEKFNVSTFYNGVKTAIWFLWEIMRTDIERSKCLSTSSAPLCAGWS